MSSQEEWQQVISIFISLDVESKQCFSDIWQEIIKFVSIALESKQYVYDAKCMSDQLSSGPNPGLGGFDTKLSLLPQNIHKRYLFCSHGL